VDGKQLKARGPIENVNGRDWWPVFHVELNITGYAAAEFIEARVE
jgi:hypothetical protein